MVPADPAIEVRQSIIDFLKEPLNALPVFLERVILTSRVDTTSVYLALMYLQRAQIKVRFAINEHNVHRLFTASLLLAAKFWEDQPLHTKWWSTFTGFTTRLICRMEEELIGLLDWDLFVTPEDYTDFRLDYEDLIERNLNVVPDVEAIDAALAALQSAPSDEPLGNESSSHAARSRAPTPTAFIETQTASDADVLVGTPSYDETDSELSEIDADSDEQTYGSGAGQRDCPRSAPIVQLLCRDNSSARLPRRGVPELCTRAETGSIHALYNVYITKGDVLSYTVGYIREFYIHVDGVLRVRVLVVVIGRWV